MPFGVGTPKGTASVCLYLTADDLYDGVVPRILILVGGSLTLHRNEVVLTLRATEPGL